MGGHGVLQQFIVPQGLLNETIRVEWTANGLQMERRVNQNRLDNLRIDMHDRAITYEGPQTQCVDRFISSMTDASLYRRLTQTSWKIALRIAAFKKQTPQKLVLYYKVPTSCLIFSSPIFVLVASLFHFPSTQRFVPYSHNRVRDQPSC